MSNHRTIIPLVVALAATAFAAPDASKANPLLSGYGGPGQGNQAILGAALLNGPRGGGGSSSGGSSSGGSSSANQPGSVPGAAASESSPSSAATGGQATSGRSGGAPNRPATHTHARGTDRQLTPAAGAARAPSARALRLPLARSEALISGDDLLFALLALGALAFTGVLTRRLARTTVQTGPDS